MVKLFHGKIEKLRAMNVHIGHVYDAEDTDPVAHLTLQNTFTPSVLQGPEAHLTCPITGLHDDVSHIASRAQENCIFRC